VLVIDGDTARQRDVTVGARFPGKAEILSGLAANEQVITHGALKVRPGQPVRVIALDDGSQPLEVLLKSLETATSGES
jgi:membrane fusion protein (multidrug efflux system)